jgi:hypothetical protein
MDLGKERKPLSAGELDALRQLSQSLDTPTWRAMIEGRDMQSGDTFIMVGSDSDNSRLDDLFVSDQQGRADPSLVDLVVALRNDFPTLVENVHALRQGLGVRGNWAQLSELVRQSDTDRPTPWAVGRAVGSNSVAERAIEVGSLANSKRILLRTSGVPVAASTVQFLVASRNALTPLLREAIGPTPLGTSA